MRSSARCVSSRTSARIRTSQELARLQSFVAESLKRFEFGLRRKVDADKNAIALTGSDEVPEEFRKLVEQYYRSLARSPR